MRILQQNPEPIYRFPCVNVGPGGKQPLWTTVPVISACVDVLPPGLDALLVTADLQFVDTNELPETQRLLLGQSVAQELGLMADVGLLPSAEATGVLLAGDFYVHPALRSRGGLGDVMGVWKAFGDAFGWVAGVAGNHDSFHGQVQRPAALQKGTTRLLDGDVVTLGGLRIGGVSGVLGTSKKPWRKPPHVYRSALQRVLEQEPDIVLLHESPQSPSPNHKGIGKAILTREILEHASTQHPPLVISGHVGWKDPLDAVEHGPQFLNVEERVVLLTRALLGPL